jgi:aspartate aminotransferase/aminotransferase
MTRRAPRTERPHLQLSERVAAIPEALSIYINQLVYDQQRKGRDITVLSLGEAFFEIPMFEFSRLDFAKGYHYSDSKGLPELRAKVAAFYGREYGAAVDPHTDLLVSAGSKPLIYFGMQATLDPGDEVLIHEPGWLSYQEQARLVGAKPAFIPHGCPVADFHRYFTDATRMVVINNPNNPAGRLYDEAELRALYEQCRSQGIYVLVDEAYSDFVAGEGFASMARVVPDRDGVIVVNSLSKNMGMSGWRVGYVIAAPALIRQILKINQHVLTCAPTLLQHYMARYFDEVTAVTLPQVREVVAKRKRVAAQIDALGLERLSGGCTFYFLVGIGDFPGSSLEFALHMLLHHQVSVVPGSAYGKSTSRFVRVGVGTESEERIHDALLRIQDMAGVKEYDAGPLRERLAREGFHMFEEAGDGPS